MVPRGLWTLGMVLLAGVLVLAAAPAASAFRVGYLEGGGYWTYSRTLAALRLELDRQGWGPRIQYPADAHFSPGWEAEKKAELAGCARRLMARSDLDLILAAGSEATAALLDCNNRRTPIVAMAVADPVRSGFVVSESDSGIDNFTVRIVPGRYRRMFEIFHAEVGFSKLGLMYHDSENERQYASVADAHEVARARGFAILAYPGVSRAETTAECLAGIQTLIAQGMDAFFIPSLVCFDWSQCDVASLLNVLIEHRIPTFAREGQRLVQAGALMGFATYDFSNRGRFLAERVIRILEGAMPRALPMVDHTIPKISLNLAVAKQIGFDPSFDFLRSCDEVFDAISLPADRLLK